MEEKIEIQGVTASTIYEGGALSQISSEQLKDNIIAIKQLINNYNLVVKQSEEKDVVISSLKSQIEYLRTSPFVSIISAIINVVASILVGLGINLLTAEKPDTSKGNLLLVLGAILIIVGSLSTILYPYVRAWFNKGST
jgi:energy-converting hydrogenase Eha subunit E